MTREPSDPTTSQDGEHVAIRGVQYPLTQSSSPFRQFVRIAVGLLLGLLRPARQGQLAAGDVGRDHLSQADRLIVAALVWMHRRRGSLGALTGLHRWLWRSAQAQSVHEQAAARHRTWWIERHSTIVAPLREALVAFAAAGRPIGTLCEIGCGSGRVLADLAERLPEIPRLIGLDLSDAQVRSNRERLAGNPRLAFEVADATTWLDDHGGPGWAYLVNGGVLEYFSEPMLERLLRGIAERHAPAVFALVEPIADDYDLDRETSSRPYNSELSLGHNYPWWLRRCGWQVRYQARQDVGGVRWLLVVAETGRPAT